MKNNDEYKNIDFDKLLQESRELCKIVEENDVLGQKLNEILKVMCHIINIQNEKIREITSKCYDYECKYNNLKIEYDELEKDYDFVFNANQRKSELLQVIKDNEEEE